MAIGEATTVPTLKSHRMLPIAPMASTVPTLRRRYLPRIAPTAPTAPTLRFHHLPPIAPTASAAPTLRFRHLPPIAPTVRLRHLPPTTSTATAHRTHTASTTFVAVTLARIPIPACAINWREIPHRAESRSGIHSERTSRASARRGRSRRHPNCRLEKYPSSEAYKPSDNTQRSTERERSARVGFLPGLLTNAW